MKIRNKISLGFLAIFIVVLILIGVSFDLYSSANTKKDAYAYLTSSNRARAEHIRTFIKEKEKTAVILAAASVYRDLLKEPVGSPNYKIIKGKIDKRLVRTLESDPDIHQVLILDKKGLIIAASDKTEEGADKSQDDYFINGQKGVYFKSIYYSGTVKSLVYAISAPVLDDSGAFLGLSVLRFSSDDFYSVVASENGLGSTEENFLINQDRFFITPSRFLGEEVILKQKVETENARDCFDPEEIEYVKKNGYGGVAGIESHAHIIEAKDYRGVDITGTHAYIPETGWCLITKVDTSDLLAYRYNLLLFILGVFLIAGLILFFFGYFLAERITWPLNRLSLVAEKIKQGDLDVRADIKTDDEIGDLANSFNFMVEAVHESQSSIEQKVEDQTKDLNTKAKELADQKTAILNILEDVEQEKTKNEAILASIGDGLIVTNEAGNIALVNEATEKMLGVKSNEIIGKSYSAIFPIEDEKGEIIPIEKRPMTTALAGGSTTTTTTTTTGLSYYYKRLDGTKFPVSLSVTPVILDGKIIGAIDIFRDITKEKDIDKVKTEFVSLASHQLRTPLSAINWYTEMLLNGDAGVINDEQRKYLGEVSIGNKRMVALVNALLNVSRLDLGTFIIEPEPTDITAMIKSVLDELRPQITTKKLKLTETYDPKVPTQFSSDQKLLRMVFQNLLSNAVKYTPEAGSVAVSLVPKGSELVFSVADSGMGIPASQKDKIFSKLFRADNARESDSEGTGLGLYIVKSVIEQSGGKVWFESVESKGSTFFVSLPLSGMKKKEGTKKLD